MRRWATLIGGLAVACAPHGAAASTITYAYTQPSDTDFLQPFGVDLVAFPLDKFDQSLGQLTEIAFKYNYDAAIHYVARNPDPANGLGGLPYYGSDGSYGYDTSTFHSGPVNVPFNGTSSHTSSIFEVYATIDLHSVVTVSGAGLAPYLNGTDTYDAFSVDNYPQFAGGGVATGIDDGYMTVSYTYVPAVPEIPAWETMIAGFAMIGGLYHWRRRGGGRSMILHA